MNIWHILQLAQQLTLFQRNYDIIIL